MSIKPRVEYSQNIEALSSQSNKSLRDVQGGKQAAPHCALLRITFAKVRLYIDYGPDIFLSWSHKSLAHRDNKLLLLVPTQTKELDEAMEEDHPPVFLRPISNEREPMWDVEPSVPPGPLMLEYHILKKSARGLFRKVMPCDYDTKILRFKSVFAKGSVPEKPLALPGDELDALDVECGSFIEINCQNARQKKSNLAVKVGMIQSCFLDQFFEQNVNPTDSFLRLHGIHFSSGVSANDLCKFPSLASMLPIIRTRL